MNKYANFFREVMEQFRAFFSYPNFKKAFVYGILLYLIALFALLRGDIYYMDDIQNSIRDASWNHFSRYLATFIIADIFPLFKGTIDLSPLPQIFSVCVVILSSMILLYLVRKKFDLWGILSALPLGLSPYLLQLLTYKFDSLLILSLFFAILPFLFKEKRAVFIAVSIISLLCCFNIYQAGNAVYVVLSLYFAFYAVFFESHTFKQGALFLAICAINLIIASAIYKLMINPSFVGIVSYADDKMIPLNALFFPTLAKHLMEYLCIIFNDFKQTPYIILIALHGILFIVNAVAFSRRGKILALCSSVLFIVLGICVSYGLYIVLEKQVYEPRVFFGFSAFMAIISIFNAAISQKILRHIAYILVAITAYFLISFANIYGNALTKQDEYLQFRAEVLLKDLSVAIPQNATAMVDLRVNLGYHLATQTFIKKYGAISRLIPKVAPNDWWFYLRLMHLNAPYNFNDTEMCEFIEENFGSEVVFETLYTKVEKAKTCYIITVK